MRRAILAIIASLTLAFSVLLLPLSTPSAASPVTPTTHLVHHTAKPWVHDQPLFGELHVRYHFGEVSNRVIRLQRSLHFWPQDGLYGYSLRLREITALKHHHMSGAWLPRVQSYYYGWSLATHPCEEPSWHTWAGGLGWTGNSWALARQAAGLTLAPTSPAAATVDEQVAGGEALNHAPPWTTIGSCAGYHGW